MNSDLLDDIEPFYVMEILEEAQRYEKKGIDVSHLEIGEPTRKTNKLIKQYAKKAISNNYDRYSHSLGIQPLREAIVKYHKKAKEEQSNISNPTKLTIARPFLKTKRQIENKIYSVCF